MSENNKNFRDELIQRIKDAGNELIQRSESMIDSDLDLITDFEIIIDLGIRDMTIPTISIKTSVINKTYINRFKSCLTK